MYNQGFIKNNYMPINRKEERLLARQLRLDKRMSLKSIANKLGVSKGSVSIWVRDIPLTEEEKQTRYVENGKRTKDRLKNTEVVPSSKFIGWIKCQELTSNQKGKIAEAAVVLRLSILKFDVYKSVFDGEKLDIVTQAPNDTQLKKIQVRWCRKPKIGSNFITLTCSSGRKSSRRYNDEEFDFMIGYDFYTDTCYVYDANDLKNLKTRVSVKDEHAESWHKILQNQ